MSITSRFEPIPFDGKMFQCLDEVIAYCIEKERANPKPPEVEINYSRNPYSHFRPADVEPRDLYLDPRE